MFVARREIYLGLMNDRPSQDYFLPVIFLIDYIVEKRSHH